MLLFKLFWVVEIEKKLNFMVKFRTNRYIWLETSIADED